ncbi:hypothetical protein [Caballeronia sp. J97]|uniref:hypothetical protein n=1 Tax=Caballeronia sp. J97 TaxID=2805429 RepID=UPI002AB17FA2|nr:hypothetical protein [Caballeronia sp. J97]
MQDNDQTKALRAILALGEAEIKKGDFAEIDEFLAELEQEDEDGTRKGDRTDC